MQFSAFDHAQFLRDDWQQRPRLIRNPWAAWANPLAPDELAGLACDDEVEARLIVADDNTLTVEHTPLVEARFATLGTAPWTLLVQAVDMHVPAVAELMAPFDFIPNWRIDDVMVSYATDGGGVGAHYDQYDVFLIQGLGQRRWQIGGVCDATTPLLPHDHLRLLAAFTPTDEWLLNPGDMLYLPPRVAHRGVAVGDDCMTYSIGFRAPARRDLLAGWAEAVGDRFDDDDRYADPGLRAQANPGEITPTAIDRLLALATERLADRAAFARWFGSYTSTPRNADIDWSPEALTTAAAMRRRLARGLTLLRNPASRFAFVRQDAGVLLFVDGDCFECTGGAQALAERLCAERVFPIDPGNPVDPTIVALLTALWNRGSVTAQPTSR